MTPVSEIAVEVVYALPDEAFVAELRVPAGCTVGQAIDRSGLLLRFPDLAPLSLRTGIFGRPCPTDTPLAEGDRVEVYRPLHEDVKVRRRERVAQARRRRKR